MGGGASKGTEPVLLEIVKEEGEEAKPIKQPKGPTAEQRQKHALTHIPYESWCSDCVQARARDNAHRTVEDKEKKLPQVQLDYFFLTEEPETGGQAV